MSWKLLPHAPSVRCTLYNRATNRFIRVYRSYYSLAWSVEAQRRILQEILNIDPDFFDKFPRGVGCVVVDFNKWDAYLTYIKRKNNARQ